MRWSSFLAAALIAAISSHADATEVALDRLRQAAHGGAEAALDLAIRLDAGIEVPRDGDEALIWYVHAAFGGEARAFYYLGQKYETGDGIPRNTALARRLYDAARGGFPAADARLERLAVRLSDALSAPRLVPPAPGGGSNELTLAWVAAEQPEGTVYVLEVLDAEAYRVLHVDAHFLPAARLALDGPAVPGWARIHAIGPDFDRYLASDWLMVANLSAEASLIPAKISLSIDAGDAVELARDLAEDFRQSGIAVEMMSGDRQVGAAGVSFRYEADRAAASSVARMMPGPYVEPSFVPADPEASRPPRPGLIELTLMTRQDRG